MKKVLLGLVVVAGLGMTSCGPGEAEKKAGAKICECMEMEGMASANCLMEIAEDEELAGASESGTISVLEADCPEGAEKFKELSGK